MAVPAKIVLQYVWREHPFCIKIYIIKNAFLMFSYTYKYPPPPPPLRRHAELKLLNRLVLYL